MVKVTFTSKATETFSKAAKYRVEDGWYILTDDADEEVGRAQVKDVASIRKGGDFIGLA